MGTWECTIALHLPGAPPTEMHATERFELVCNGLWLRSIFDSTTPDRPFQALSITGWNPKDETYVKVWVDSVQPSVTRSVATWDAKNGTWSGKTISGEGPSRSVLVWKDADTMVETSYVKEPTGKESVLTEVTRKRRKPNAEPVRDAVAHGTTKVEARTDGAPAGDAAGDDVRAAHAELGRMVGRWRFDLVFVQPDGSKTESKGTEAASAVCGGAWVWTDLETTLMGAPLEGHCLAGFDATRRKFVSFWIDSTTPYLGELAGTADPKTGALALTGHSIDAAGSEVPMTETVRWTGEHARVAKLRFGSEDAGATMELTYERVHQEGAHGIK